MERDEQGRIVRRPPPPGADVDEDLPEAFPAFEHSQRTFEGEIERMGAFARGTRRVRALPRGVGLLVVIAILLPVLLGIFSLIWQSAFAD